MHAFKKHKIPLNRSTSRFDEYNWLKPKGVKFYVPNKRVEF